MEKNCRCLVYLIVALISLYMLFHPELLTAGGYALAIDGLVISRTLLGIFAMTNLVSLVRCFYGEKL